MKITIKKEQTGNRLDTFLSSELNTSRSVVTNAIKNERILVNNSKVKPGYLTRENDEIVFETLLEEIKIEGENIPLNIYYEDEHIIVVNKPSNMVVHPAPGNYKHTLVNALIYHTKNNLSNIGDEMRVGIVHRIDKDTSGLLVVAKTNEAHRILADDFKYRRIKRKYIALVSGTFDVINGKIDAPIGRDKNDRKKMCVTPDNSKKSVTNFKVLERFKNATLLELILESGRTHQIRVHMAYINHPVINDTVYGKTIINNYGQMLHAGYLGFNHPITKELMEFNAPAENEFDNIVESFRNS